ncbi:zinc finger FYVE domain containing 27 L homeolog isoform X2 [Xenopus laevis]|uniref:Zinc finger FYVE domain containing 27 L homeolog isoform X2 n=1 Tax=Xenopus laevis TaxID=8355 RepID=A0A8J1LC04_XENLA|nr:zinc finger FYVE domain containing 27 L homeolog isoform X2 [Xenopus laevis]
MQAAERDASSLAGSSWSEGSPTMTESHSESPQSTTKSRAFDLFNLVVSYKRIEIYLEPIKDSWEGIKYLLRWQMPLCSVFTCITLNIFLLTLNEVAWFSVGALFISIPALIGYLQEMSKIHIPEPELARRKYYSVRREELQKVKLSRQEAVAEFKSFLIHLESILNLICGSCERVYQVLYWQNPAASFQFYGLLLGAVCILYLLPLYLILAIVNSTLFIKNSDFYRVVAECKASLQQKGSTESSSIGPAPSCQEVENGSILDQTPTPVPTSSEFSSCLDEFTSHKLSFTCTASHDPSLAMDLSPGSVEEAEEAEPDEEFKDAIEDEDDVSQCSAGYDSLQDNGFLSKNEVIKSKVSKFTEKLRKRYPTNNLGTCTGCNATFSVLTRKRYLK